MASFIRPENALKQAENLIAVNHKDQALQTLHDVITSKRRTWSKVLEDIMKKYVQLCVELRKGKFAKEGLHQYKLTCQVNYNSLEVVIKHFLVLAESQAKEAQSKAKQTILDIEDLEAEESAESLILTAVSGEDRTDRTDREIVTPWLRFLWETYRTVLETLRNNAKLESLYHETAQAAFNFCLHYQRKNEFRRLSDILRNHLSNLGKYPNQPQNINLSNPETLKVHLVTRFTQLNVATELELWQEAFRSVEDIHGLMTMAHKPLTPEMTSTYFQRLARIFLVSNNHLFHAYAWFKYFAIARNQLKDRTEYTTMASSVLLAALSIPLSDPKQADEQYFEYDLQKEKNLRMGTLLGFASTPKREVLLQDLVSKNIHRTVFPELQDIYEILEKKFNPLSLCKKMAEKFAFIKTKPELAIYEEQLQKLTFLRLIQQLSQVYESMNISEFKGMISFMDSHTIEKLLVSAVKRKFAGVRIDHQNGAIHFGGNESEKLRDQLTQLAKGLQQASVMINPKPRENEVYVKTKREAFVKIVDSLKDMFAYFHNRRTIIEKRKFEVESNNLEAERKRVKEREVQEKAKAAADAKKALKIQRDLAEKLKKKEAEKKAQDDKIQKLSVYVRDVNEAAAIAATMDPTDFINKKNEEERKKKADKDNALVNLATELTHRERALRENERALLVEQNERKKVEARETFIKQQEKYLTNHREQHTEDLAEKTRLTRMANARAQFEERVMSARRVQYEKLKADQERRLAEIKEEREEERAQIAKQEEERRAKIEEEKRQIEEREREKERLEEEKRQEEDARREKLAEQAELQRKREAEALQKRREEDEKAREAQRLKEEERRQAQPAREPARESSWRDNNNNRRDERPNDRFARDERPNDRFSRDERPRDFGSRDERPRDGDRWARREEAPAPRRDDGPQRRDDGPSNDRWGSRRDDGPPRREDSNDRWGAQRRDDGPQRREDAPPRREDSARADGGDRWGSRRDDGPQRRDDAPPARREEREREERPTTERWGANRDRDAAPRREDSARADGGDRWGSRRDDVPQRREERPQREERREERPQREEQPQRSASWRREESDRAPERKQEERAPREEKPKEVPAEKPAPVKREEESAPKKDDGFSTVASKRKGRK